eukprot:scaffold19028_cov47-Phaeocystis_antarctica.AAC.1
MADEDFAHLAGCDWWAPLLAAAAEAAAAETEAGMLPCEKQGRYGRPARPKRLIGRGWPKLGAA